MGGRDVTVVFQKRAHNPLLLAAGLGKTDGSPSRGWAGNAFVSFSASPLFYVVCSRVVFASGSGGVRRGRSELTTLLFASWSLRPASHHVNTFSGISPPIGVGSLLPRRHTAHIHKLWQLTQRRMIARWTGLANGTTTGCVGKRKWLMIRLCGSICQRPSAPSALFRL